MFLLLTLTLGLAADLQPIGTFHGSETVTSDGETWLGLFERSDGSWALQATLVEVTPVFDPMVDRIGERSAMEVLARSDHQPIVLVRGLDLRVGALDASVTMDSGAPHWLETEVGSGLFLHDDRGRLAVAPWSEAGVVMLWSGDLDRDGRPDFLLDVARADGVSETVLSLSGQAEPGRAVGPVATHQMSGC